jgi:hypothetical protein
MCKRLRAVMHSQRGDGSRRGGVRRIALTDAKSIYFPWMGSRGKTHLRSITAISGGWLR